MPNQKSATKLHESLKALLRDSLAWVEEEQLKLLQESPYARASNAEIKLFAALRGESRSISELSRFLGISRQAVHQSVHRLIGRGVVRLESTETNKRDKLVIITDEGREVQKITAQHFQIIEKKMAKNIGRENLELIRKLLKDNLAKSKTSD